jgi:hypothetical protein
VPLKSVRTETLGLRSFEILQHFARLTDQGLKSFPFFDRFLRKHPMLECALIFFRRARSGRTALATPSFAAYRKDLPKRVLAPQPAGSRKKSRGGGRDHPPVGSRRKSAPAGDPGRGPSHPRSRGSNSSTTTVGVGVRFREVRRERPRD